MRYFLNIIQKITENWSLYLLRLTIS